VKIKRLLLLIIAGVIIAVIVRLQAGAL